MSLFEWSRNYNEFQRGKTITKLPIITTSTVGMDRARIVKKLSVEQLSNPVHACLP